MGTWGIKPFENDAAMDWAADVEECKNLSVITSVFDLEDEYVDADDGVLVIAAALMIAASQDKELIQDVPELCRVFIEVHNKEIGTINKAMVVKIIDKVLDEDNSELSQLWMDNDDEYPAWKLYIDRIKSVLEK